MPGSVEIEITAQGAGDVRTALAGGADRVELCSALGVAGLTPSTGTVEVAVEIAREAGAPGFVDVLVRPREGDFTYDADELRTAVRDVRRAVEAGADGVVIGALTHAGRVDVRATQEMIDAADGATITFHRAFDVVTDQLVALEQLVDLGFVRVLTSGGAPRTGEGLGRLTELAARAEGRIQVMAGGGVRVEDIPRLAAAGVRAVHLSARRTVVGGPNRPGENATYFRTDLELVRAAVAAARTGQDAP